MDARHFPLKHLIRQEVYQFRVPLYQRPYSWEEEECRMLWNDIFQAGEKAKQYFLGCIVCINEGQEQWEQPRLIIDGQQRITTVLLLLEAMARGVERGKDFGVSAAYLRKNLIDAEREGEDQYKIILSRDDKDTFIDLVRRRERKEQEAESRLIKNFRFFEKKIEELSADDAKTFNKGLMGLQVVSILLNHDEDDPQHVFESMNSKGKDLSDVDLIRNYMLMELVPSEQREAYNTYWKPIERCLQVGGG